MLEKALTLMLFKSARSTAPFQMDTYAPEKALER